MRHSRGHDGREFGEAFLERVVGHAERPHPLGEAQVGCADRGEVETCLGLRVRGAGLDEQAGDGLRPDLVELVDEAQRAGDVGQADGLVEPLGNLAVVDLDDIGADRQLGEGVRDDEREFRFEVRREGADVDDVDIALRELAVTTLLGTLSAPDLLDLVALERERELAGVLNDIPRQRHSEIEVQAERGLAVVGATPEAGHAVDLLVDIAALAGKAFDRLHRARLDRREAVHLEGAADDVKEVQLDESLCGQELEEPTDRGDLAGAHRGSVPDVATALGIGQRRCRR